MKRSFCGDLRLSALLLQFYGRGLADAATALLDSPHAAEPIYRVILDETLRIDPRWPEQDRERREGHCADVVAYYF